MKIVSCWGRVCRRWGGGGFSIRSPSYEKEGRGESFEQGGKKNGGQCCYRPAGDQKRKGFSRPWEGDGRRFVFTVGDWGGTGRLEKEGGAASDSEGHSLQGGESFQKEPAGIGEVGKERRDFCRTRGGGKGDK